MMSKGQVFKRSPKWHPVDDETDEGRGRGGMENNGERLDSMSRVEMERWKMDTTLEVEPRQRGHVSGWGACEWVGVRLMNNGWRNQLSITETSTIETSHLRSL